MNSILNPPPENGECAEFSQRIKRLPRKHHKMWLSNFAQNAEADAPFQYNVKYGSVLSLPNGLDLNHYNAWYGTNIKSPKNNKKYSAYAISSYNVDLETILGKFGIRIKIRNIPILNYLLSNIQKYLSLGNKWSDIQVVIWRLISRKNAGLPYLPHNKSNVHKIFSDCLLHGRNFRPKSPLDSVAVFIAVANDWSDPEINPKYYNQLIIVPLKFELFNPSENLCNLFDWMSYY